VGNVTSSARRSTSSKMDLESERRSVVVDIYRYKIKPVMGFYPMRMTLGVREEVLSYNELGCIQLSILQAYRTVFK
jgi:hypothetical protein